MMKVEAVLVELEGGMLIRPGEINGTSMGKQVEIKTTEQREHQDR